VEVDEQRHDLAVQSGRPPRVLKDLLVGPMRIRAERETALGLQHPALVKAKDEDADRRCHDYYSDEHPRPARCQQQLDRHIDQPEELHDEHRPLPVRCVRVP
jgi:hypothetical protein